MLVHSITFSVARLFAPVNANSIGYAAQKSANEFLRDAKQRYQGLYAKWETLDVLERKLADLLEVNKAAIETLAGALIVAKNVPLPSDILIQNLYGAFVTMNQQQLLLSRQHYGFTDASSGAAAVRHREPASSVVIHAEIPHNFSQQLSSFSHY
jgi:hypothetical protein